MALKLFELFGSIKVNSDKAVSELKDIDTTAEKTSNNISNLAKTGAKLVGLIATFKALTKAISESVKASQEQESQDQGKL